MHSGRRLATVLVAAAAIAVAVVVVRAQTPGTDAKSWLDLMNSAMEELNYRGSFVYVFNRDVQILKISHRFADGEIRERISGADDNEREILRSNNGVYTVFPEQRRVLVEELQSSTIPRTDALIYSDELERNYDFQSHESGAVAGRATQHVSIRPRDGYRYGYRLWLDRETGLPLKSQVVGEDDEVVEQILYTSIEIVDSVPEAEVVPAVGVDGFEWVRRIKAKPEVSSDEIWGATRLPDGFGLVKNTQSLLAGSTYPVQHLVYSDGLATVSVFISHPKSEAGADVEEGLVRWGGVSIYSLRIDGRLARAMGEVPPRTVQRIATSLDAR